MSYSERRIKWRLRDKSILSFISISAEEISIDFHYRDQENCLDIQLPFLLEVYRTHSRQYNDKVK